MKILTLTSFLLLTGRLFPQYALEAVVLDGMTRKPVVSAHVYLDGTTKGTITDSQGKFKLTVSNIINTSLVISHISYERQFFQNPFKSLPSTIFLETREEMIPEVTVYSKINKSKRREMLNVFRKIFFGEHAASCTILNEEDITLMYDENYQTLTARADKPLLIVNNYLKYFIRFDLIDFRTTLLTGKLTGRTFYNPPAQALFSPISPSSNADRSDFLKNPMSLQGTASFSDIGNNTKSLIKRRKSIYYKSNRHFFHLIAKNNIKFEGYSQKWIADKSSSKHFGLFSEHLLDVDGKGPVMLSLLYDQNSLFYLSDSEDDPSMKTVIVKPEIKIHISNTPVFSNTTAVKKPHIIDTVIVIDSKKIFIVNEINKTSSISFFTDMFHIDTYGNTDLLHNFNMGGDFGRHRFGDLLPLNYMPGEEEKSKEPVPQDAAPKESGSRSRYFIEKQSVTYPFEKIHVHTDKTNYVAGETLWMRIYLTDYRTNAPATESSCVYGELYDPADSLIQRIKVRQDSLGMFHGYFNLLPNLAEGHYRLRFYTSYMEETGEDNFFNRNIFISSAFARLHPFEEMRRTETAASAFSKDYNVSFFPEGGSLLADIPMRVAFKALNEDGLGLSMTGQVVSSTGEAVSDFASNALGMGSFTVLAKPGEQYIAQCRDSQGLEKRFELPETSAGKANLKAVQSKDSLVVEAIFSESRLLPDTLRLLMQCRGVIIYNEPLSKGDTLFFEKAALPSGVIQLLLLENKLTPLSERLIFNVNTKDLVKVGITASKEYFSPREKVVLSVDLKAFNLEPLQDGFSVSVTADMDSSINILSTLLLTSDLKGYVEKPAWYFTEDRRLDEIDHLLLTQGWSRYNMVEVLKGLIKKPKIFPEEAAMITGQVITSGFVLSGTTEKFVKINAAGTINPRLPENVERVVDKNFELAYNEYPNGTSYTLQTIPQSSRFEIRPILPSYPPNHLKLPYNYQIEIVHAPAPPIVLQNFGHITVNDPMFYGINESLFPLSIQTFKKVADFSHPGYMGTILFTTAEKNAGINNALHITPLGFQVSREFYSPAYDTQEQKEDPTPDMRSTVYWRPDTQTDEDGKATISFYAADVTTSYLITIEGVTSDGIFIRKTATIAIK